MSKLFSTFLLASMITQLQAMENPILEAARETDEDFIARAKEKCAFVAAKRVEKAEDNEDGWFDRVNVESYWLDKDITCAYTPKDQGASSIELTDSKKRPQFQDTLIIVNALLAQFASKTKQYDVRHIALSADARLIALLKNSVKYNTSEFIWRENIIEVYELDGVPRVRKISGIDISLSNHKTIKVLGSFSSIAGIEFNNQASKIVIFGWDKNKFNGLCSFMCAANKKYSTDHHLLFELDSTEKLT